MVVVVRGIVAVERNGCSPKGVQLLLPVDVNVADKFDANAESKAR